MGEGHCFLSPQWASWDSPRAIMSPMADPSPPPKPSHQPSRSTEGPPNNGKVEEGVGRPGRIESSIRRVDKFQQDHRIFGFPFAVVQKFGNDQAGAKAALVAYYGLFALFRSCLCSRPSWVTPSMTTRSCRKTSSTAPLGTFRSLVLS